MNYSALKSLLDNHVPKNSRVLNVGCGNSKFHEDMFDDGYTDIVNIDISANVINQMKARAEQANAPMEYKVMDATDMTGFDDE